MPLEGCLKRFVEIGPNIVIFKAGQHQVSMPVFNLVISSNIDY